MQDSIKIFRNWRPQGMTIRHSHVGQKISEDQANEIMEPVFGRAGFSTRFVPDKGIIRLLKGGRVDKAQEQLDTIWSISGSDAVATEKRDAEEIARKKEDLDKQNALIAALWERRDAVAWIDVQLAEAEMNDYNKLWLAKYLKGESDDICAHAVTWKWAEPLERIGAVKCDGDNRIVDFEFLRELFSVSYDFTDTK